MVSLLTAIVLAAHLVCVNIASAGPLCAIWYDWKRCKGDATAGDQGRWLAGAALLALLLGGALGLGLGALLWSDALHGAISAVHRRIFFGVWELLFSLVLMAGQYLWWRFSKSSSLVGLIGRSALAVLAASNLLYHFPFLFSVIRSLSASGAPDTPLSSADFRSLMMEPSTFALAVHFWLASFAVCGVAMMLRGLSPGIEEEDRKRLIPWAGRTALIPTLFQMPVGAWLLFQFPTPVQNKLIGGDMIAAGLLGASVLSALGLTHQLASVAMGETSPKATYLSAGLMSLVVVLMSGVLRSIS